MVRLRRFPWIGAATVAGALLALLAGGCGDDGDEGGSTAQPEDLIGRTFVSVRDWSGEGSSFSSPVTVTFTDDGGISWKADCNTARAAVEITADRLDVGQIASTMMGCPGPAMKQDDELSGFFAADPSWSLDGNRLTLRSSRGSIEVELHADVN